ncbi:lectin like domain-containing protein [Eggerthella guodeyinii]|uniref:lectin like domain-containing protein n=1 Tax=Eggerthella guodeyinii TaxID=2690837 RepID=UPI001C5539DD|nr:lectin like domain-containing protein [Eggerthella guodeyinii]
MTARTPFPRLARIVLACALAAGLAPALAHAEEAPRESDVVDRFAAKSEQALNRYALTGNIDDLRDVTAYANADAVVAARSSEALPPTYDLRDEGLVTPVKLQNPWGTCWSFGAIAACETSIMSELGWNADAGQVLDLSELHTAWFAYTPLADDAGSQAGEGRHSTSSDPNAILNEGGMLYTVTSVLSSGIGPVLESDAPYRNKAGDVEYVERPTDGARFPYCYSAEGDWSVPEDQRFAQVMELEESCVLPSPASKDADGAYRYDPAGTDAIKGELKEGRAVEIAFAADQSKPNQADPAKYINANDNAWAHYTYDADAEATHAVAIVGWDDAYGADNFLEGHQPPGDGAWIVKNSWGSSSESFPNGFEGTPINGWGVDGEGYFYLSYYDRSISVPESFDFYTEGFEPDAEAGYYFVNQYDYMPSDGVAAIQKDEEVAMANVFEAEENQLVRSLSCETASPNTTATYELYRLNDGFENPTDGELLTAESRTYEYGGYHRIQLDEGGFPLEKGQRFSVVVTLRQADGQYAVLTDRALNEEGLEKVNENLPEEDKGIVYSVGVVNPGESCLLEDGVWTDWADDVAAIKAKAVEETGTSTFDYDNFALKAYADPIAEPPIHEAVAVPDLVGLTEAEALAALERVGLRGEAGAAEHSDAVEAGRVARQDTAAGAEADKGYLVTYFLSLGKDPAAAPGGPAGGGDEQGAAAPVAKRLASTGDEGSPSAVALAVVGAIAACSAAAAFAFARKRRPRC